MKHKLLLIYCWLIRTLLFFFPDIPILMRFRGFLYSFGMQQAGRNFQVAHDVILNTIENIAVGENVYIAMNNILFGTEKIFLGNNVMLGPGCVFATGNHGLKNGSYRYGSGRKSPISIGEGSWIGAHCICLAGLSFPDESVAAAGSILTHKLINKGAGVYVGSPAQLIKKIE